MLLYWTASIHPATRMVAPFARTSTLESHYGLRPACTLTRSDWLSSWRVAPRRRRATRVPRFLSRWLKYHPKELHWYLPLIGVDPAHQGRGYGDALLRLERFDRQKVPMYLESTNPLLYRRDGFEQLGTIQANSSPTLVPMLRRPS